MQLNLGQRMGLSEQDGKTLGGMYGCPGNVTSLDPNSVLSDQMQQHASSSTYIGTGFSGSCEDANETGFYGAINNNLTCADLRHACGHIALGPDVRSTCPRACGHQRLAYRVGSAMTCPRRHGIHNDKIVKTSMFSTESPRQLHQPLEKPNDAKRRC